MLELSIISMMAALVTGFSVVADASTGSSENGLFIFFMGAAAVFLIAHMIRNPRRFG